jgi:hypothetical protein
MTARTLALAAVLVLVACANALAAPVPATLRVEGPSSTLHEERGYATDTRTVPVGGCRGGTDTRELPGATALGILEDARQATGLDYDTDSYASGPGGVFVCQIGGVATPSDFSSFWLYKVDHVLPETTAAGEYQLAPDDRVLWYFTSDFNARTLELDAPERAATGESVSAEVLSFDNQGSAQPAAGAEVSIAGPRSGTATAGADGRAPLSFDAPGTYRLKAERTGEIRSNADEICVYEPGSGDCGTPASGPVPPVPPPAPPARDEQPPVARIATPRDGATYRRAPRVIAGTVEENAGIHQVYVRVRAIGRGGCRWLSGARETFTRPGTCARARFIRIGAAPEWSYQLPFALPAGRRYVVDVKVLDRALNRGTEQVRFRVAR